MITWRHWQQFKLLLWKNFLLQRRRPISTLFEVFLPVVLVVVLVVIRIHELPTEYHKAYKWKPFSVNKLPSIYPRKGLWTVSYFPRNNETDAIMMGVKELAHAEGFHSEEDAVNAVSHDLQNPIEHQKYLAAIVFNNIPGDSTVSYTLRFPATPRTAEVGKSTFFPEKWSTEFIYPYTFTGLGPRNNESKFGGPPSYSREGFLALQRILDESIISMRNKNFKNPFRSVNMNRFPYPAQVIDRVIVLIQQTFPLLLMLSLTYCALTIVKDVVYEKEKKLKESMKIMGMSGWIHWVAWFITKYILLWIPIVLISFLFATKFSGQSGKFINAGDGVVLFLFLSLYALASVMFCFMVSTFFYRANLAAAAGGVGWFLMYIPYLFMASQYNQH